MVIRGQGPNLSEELCCSGAYTGFPGPDLLDHVPIRVVAFSHPRHRRAVALRDLSIMQR